MALLFYTHRVVLEMSYSRERTDVTPFKKSVNSTEGKRQNSPRAYEMPSSNINSVSAIFVNLL